MSYASDVDTTKFASGVNDTGGKFATGVNDTGANNGNIIRMLTT
jgi:hypothetical protein